MANATLEWTSNEIPPQSFITLEIVWSPTAIWSTREVIQFTDNRNFKKDVPVILKSVDKTQNLKTTLRRAADNKVITKKLTLKSPSRPKMQRNRLTVFNPSMVPNVNGAKERRSMNPDMGRVLAPAIPSNAATNTNVTFDGNTAAAVFTADKENVSPPRDICGVLDSMVFTPVGKSRNDTNLDYLASLPTPGSNVKSTPMTYPRHQTHLSAAQFANRLDDIEPVISTPYNIQNRTTVIGNMETPIDRTGANTSQYASQKTPSIITEHTFNVSSLQTPGAEIAHGAIESLQSHKYNLDVNQHHPHHLTQHSPRMQTISENSELSVNRTQTISSPMAGTQLFAIAEEHSKAELSETYVKPSTHHLTFNLEESTAAVDENLVRDVRLVGTPLKKKFQSLKELNDSRNNLSIEQMILKNNQGSMPNLHKMETVKSIENNRYFYHSKEKDLQQGTASSSAQDEADDDMEHLGDTSICSIKSTISLVGFQEHEILAQSSVFNLNEIGRGKSQANVADIGNGFGKRSKHVSHNTTTELNASRHLSISSPTIGRTMGPPKSMHSTRDLSQSNRKQAMSAYSLNTSSSSSLNKRSNGERLIDKHSPTKRMCTDNSSPKSSKGQTIRTKAWGGKLPKKFRVPSMPNQRLQLKRPEEERVILFDPELHLRGEFECFFLWSIISGKCIEVIKHINPIYANLQRRKRARIE